MKANEFVKKHGWDSVIKAVKGTTSEETAFFETTDLEPILSKNGNTIGFDVKVYRIKYDEVKNLIASWELVEKCGGLHMAKADAMDLDGWEKTSPYWMKIKQAIADVESCQ